MGKFATYRKRGSIARGGMLPAPGPGDWETTFVPDNFKVRFVVDPPSGSPYMITRYYFNVEPWLVGFSGNVKNAFFAINEDISGDSCTISVAWATGPAHSTRSSEWSAAKVQAV
jgi:hypothetical protein